MAHGATQGPHERVADALRRAGSDGLEALAVDQDPAVRAAVATSAVTAPAMLETLAADDDANVRAAVGAHRRTPTPVLAVLARDDDRAVRRAVSSNREAPPAIIACARGGLAAGLGSLGLGVWRGNAPAIEFLGGLAWWTLTARSPQVRAALRRYPNEPVDDESADDEDPLRVDAAWRPEDLAPDFVREWARVMPDSEYGIRYAEADDADERALYGLAHHEEARLRHAVALNVRTPSCALELLAGDTSAETRMAVALHPNAPRSLLEALLLDDDPQVRGAVAHSSTTPQELQERIAREGDWYMCAMLAANTSAPASVLETLATSELGNVRMSVAANAACPHRALESLARDADGDVRAAVADNEAAPERIRALARAVADEAGPVAEPKPDPGELSEAQFERIARHGDARERSRVATAPTVPLVAQEWLTVDPDEEVRAALAGNTFSDAGVLNVLSQDPRTDVRASVAANPSAPAPALKRLARDDSRAVREAVAANPATPDDALATLARDVSPRARSAALSNRIVPEPLRIAKHQGVEAAIASMGLGVSRGNIAAARYLASTVPRWWELRPDADAVAIALGSYPNPREDT